MEYVKINQLKYRFKLLKTTRNFLRETDIIDEDKVLAMSELWSRILINAISDFTIVDKYKIIQLKNEFEITFNQKVDLELIHKNYWLRYSLNEVKFPEVIRYWINHIDSVEVYKNEINFLAFLKNKFHGAKDYKFSVEKSKLNNLLSNHTRIYNRFNASEFLNNHFVLDKKELIIEEFHLRSKHQILNGPVFTKILKLLSLLTRSNNVGKIGNIKIKDISQHRELADIIGGKLWNNYISEEVTINANIFFQWYERISFIEGNFWNCTDYMTQNAFKQLLDIATELIEKETDIIGWNEEYEKLHWENNYYLPLENTKPIKLPEPSDNPSLYEKYLWLSGLSKNNYRYPFIDSRESIRFLIYIIVRDAAISNNNERLVHLIELAGNRPYLLENIIFNIHNNYPELIPVLLTHEAIISVGMSLIKKVEYSREILDEPELTNSTTSLFKLAFNLALSNIKKLESKPLILYEIIIDLTKDYYNKPHRVTQFADIQKRGIENRLEYVLNEINSDNNLFEDIFEDFALCVYQNSQNNKSNEYGNLSVPELKILFWLISLLEKKDLPNKTECLKKIVNYIYDIYFNEINRLEIEKDEKSLIVKWYHDQESIETLPWEIFFIYLDKRKLIDFLAFYSNIKTDIPEQFEDGSKNQSYFNEKVQTVAYKIRLQLYILIHTCLKLKKTTSDDLKILIENTIINLFSWYSYDDFRDNKINIFNSHYELSNLGNYTYDLASKISQLVNSTSNKDLINSIIKNCNDVGFIARVLKNTISESDRKLLLSKVNLDNVKEYLKETFTTTEIEQLLIDLSEEKDKIDLLAEIIDYGDKHSNPNNNEWKKFSYTYKLLVAAQKGNSEDIELIFKNNKDIINLHNSNSKIDYQDTYLFYKALCAYNTNPEEGYKLYNALANRKEKNVTASLNRFASKIKWALQTEGNRTELLQSAISEWDEYEKSCSIDELKSVQENTVLNKLICYYQLGKALEFDNLWGNLNDELKHSSQLIEVRIDFLKTQKRETDLHNYIASVENYHKDSDGNIPDLIKKIIKGTEKNEASIETKIEVYQNYDLKDLSAAYVQINRIDTNNFIKIIKDANLNLETFCIKCLLLPIFEKILDQRILLKDNNDENNYTQLVSMLLESRFSFFDNWIIRTQSLGGESKITFGERDLEIEHQGRKITIIEALKLDGLNTRTIEDHIERFDRYDKIGLLFYVVLTYYEKKDGFDDTWTKYKEVVHNHNFEKTELKSNGELEELPEWQRGNIRIARTSHIRQNYDCNMYHIFVNFGS